MLRAFLMGSFVISIVPWIQRGFRRSVNYIRIFGTKVWKILRSVSFLTIFYLPNILLYPLRKPGCLANVSPRVTRLRPACVFLLAVWHLKSQDLALLFLHSAEAQLHVIIVTFDH